MPKNDSWLISSKVDLSLFLGFAIISFVVCSLPINALEGRVFFLSFSLLAIVFGYTHIFSSFIKVYGTTKYKKNNLLLLSPFFIFIIAMIVHTISIRLFWLIFALLSMHHTLMQQTGMLKLTSIKSVMLPKTLFALMTFGVPLMGTLYLLSDPRGYKPGLGWMPTLPTKYNPYIFYTLITLILIIVCSEFYLFWKSRILNFGKYLQYLISILCWFAVPVVAKSLQSTYACLTIAHGIYYLTLVYWTSKREFLFFKFHKLDAAWFCLVMFLASIVIFNFLHGGWTTNNTILATTTELILATISWSHYNFDAWIWKKNEV